MLLTAVSSRCFSSVRRCRDLRCCCCELADDEDQQRGDGKHGQAGHPDQDADLFAPVGQRRRRGRRRDDHDRKLAEAARRDQAVLAVERTGQAGGGLGQFEDLLLARRSGPEVFSDHLVEMRITREQGAVAVVHGNRRTRPERHRGKEFFEIGRLDATADGAEEFAVRSGHLARDHGGPGAGDAAVDRLDHGGRRVRVRT